MRPPVLKDYPPDPFYSAFVEDALIFRSCAPDNPCPPNIFVSAESLVRMVLHLLLWYLDDLTDYIGTDACRLASCTSLSSGTRFPDAW